MTIPGWWRYATPKGVASLSPGLLYSATLGDGAAPEPELVVGRNPDGVAAYGSSYTAPPRFVVHRPGRQTRSPAGVGTNPESQGSRVRQPLGCEMQSRWDWRNSGPPPSLPCRLSMNAPPTALVGLHLNACVSSTFSAVCRGPLPPSSLQCYSLFGSHGG